MKLVKYLSGQIDNDRKTDSDIEVRVDENEV